MSNEVAEYNQKRILETVNRHGKVRHGNFWRNTMFFDLD